MDAASLVLRLAAILERDNLNRRCNNVFGQDPLFAANVILHYPNFLYDPTGRFVYVSLTKEF